MAAAVVLLVACVSSASASASLALSPASSSSSAAPASRRAIPLRASPESVAAASASRPTAAQISAQSARHKAVRRHNVSHPWAAAPANSAASPFKDGAYVGPFLRLTDSYLDVADVADGFGPEDKMVPCNGQLVFVDLDEVGGVVFSYMFATDTWSRAPMTLNNNCSNGIQLYPRDAGYLVGQTLNRGTGLDRLLVLGGDSTENNVYWSDDCGQSWSCNVGPQPWNPREFAPIVNLDGVFLDNPVLEAGGLVGGIQASVMMAFSSDGGFSWNRPVCADASICNGDCKGTGNPSCVLPVTQFDPIGSCSASAGIDITRCYMLPDVPTFPGALATDWYSLWYWLQAQDDGFVWRLDDSLMQTGWELDSNFGASWGGFGRKVYVKGTVEGQGCWLSTDYLTEDLWLENDRANSMAAFMTSWTPYGPWLDWTNVVNPPWAPRASAAFTNSWDLTSAWLGSGMSFVNGVPSLPTFSDVWQIDAGICLLEPITGQPCGGPQSGTVDLDWVTCICNPNFAGDTCGACSAGIAYGFPDCQLCPVPSLTGGPCNVNLGAGSCDPVQGCVCGASWANPGGGCDTCSAGHWGGSCALCDACNAANGHCDGSGSSGGSGKCICNAGFVGPDCSQTAPPSNDAAAGGASSPAAAAGISVGVLLVAGAALYVYVAKLGGGPVLAKLAGSFGGGSSSVGSGRGGAESASMLRGGAPTAYNGSAMSADKVASRFGSLAAAAPSPATGFSQL